MFLTVELIYEQTLLVVQVSSLEQQLQQREHSVYEANQQLQEAEVAYLGVQQEAQHLQQDNEDLITEHGMARDLVRLWLACIPTIPLCYCCRFHCHYLETGEAWN